jgi:hypothetical protein
VEYVLSVAFESRASIGHNAFPLRRSYFAAEVSLARSAELALSTFRRTATCQQQAVDLNLYRLEGHDKVSRLDKSNVFTNRLYNSSSLMSEDNRKGTLRVFSREGIGI